MMTDRSVPTTAALCLWAALFLSACVGGAHGLSARAGGAPSAVLEAPTPCAGGVAPQLMLVNGTVFTADPRRPRAEAIAIGGQQVCAVGTTEEIRRLSTAATRIVGLGGKLVIPGINDAHVHEPTLFRPTALDTRGATSAGDLIRSVAIQAKQHPSGSWLRGELPLSLMDAPGIDRTTLDAGIQDHPLLLSVLGGHAGVLNSAGLRALGVRDDAPSTSRRRYGKDRPGRSNGWLYEYAFYNRQRHWCGDRPEHRRGGGAIRRRGDPVRHHLGPGNTWRAARRRPFREQAPSSLAGDPLSNREHPGPTESRRTAGP